MTEDPAVSMWAFMASWFTPTCLFLLLNLMIGTIALTSRFTSHKNPTQQPGHNPPNPLARAPSFLGRVRSFNFSLYRSNSSDPVTLQHYQAPVIYQNPYPNSDHPSHQLVRTPSLLERVKSFNLFFHRVDHSEQVTTFPHSEEGYQTHYPNVSSGPVSGNYTDNQATRTEPGDSPAKMRKSASEKTKAGGESPARVKKSASEKSALGCAGEEEAVERQRPATVREEKKKGGGGRGSETVSFGEDEGVDAKADDFINRFKHQLKLQRLDSLQRFKEMLNRGSGK